MNTLQQYLAVFVSLMTADVRAAQSLFPMHVGDTWTYEAEVKWTGEGGSVKSATLPWETKIVAVVDRKETQAVVVRGFPTLLAWFDPTQPAGPMFDVLVTTPKGVWITHEQTDEAEARAIAAKAVHGDFAGDQLLQFPLRDSDCVAREGPSRTDYCWLLVFKGATPKDLSWQLGYQSLPGHQLLAFREDIGVTEYTFVHHGTVASAHAVLKRHSVAP